MKILKTYKHATSSLTVYDEGIELATLTKKRFIKKNDIAEVILKRFSGQVHFRTNSNEIIKFTLPTDFIKQNEHERLEQFMVGKISEDEFINTQNDFFISEETRLKQIENQKKAEELAEEYKKSPTKYRIKIAFILLLLIVVIGSFGYIIFGGTNTSNNSETRTERIADKTPSAYNQAQRFVKAALKAPSTAQFPLTGNTQEVQTNRFLSQGYVDSQNSFGAMLRTSFVVTLRYNGAESYDALRNSANWELEELILDDQVIYPAQ